MIHQVTVFFPAPGVHPAKARVFLFQRRMATMKSFGKAGTFIVPLKRHIWKTRQKNYLWTEVTVWWLEKHDVQARRHMPPRTRNSKRWRQPK